jgi:peptidoglycan/LPS O-acetylase OafA/YrhL
MRPIETEQPSEIFAHATKAKNQNPRYVLGYNPRLDGLRGVATLCVLFYHYLVSGFQAGLYGLDIFFVISGYLITKVLLKYVSDGHSLGQFYWNRFLRLMPALASLSVAIFLISVIFPALFNSLDLRDDVISSFLYVANWTRAFSLNVPAYLGNCWSLGVEEQFYLLWPFICVFFAAKKKPVILEITLFLLACSIAWTFWLDTHQAGYNRVVNGFDTRCSGLLIGCCLALIGRKAYGKALERMLSRFWPLAILAYSILVIFTEDHWYPAYGLITSGAAVILIAAAYHAPHSFIGKLLELPPFVFVGKISYSVYLWHYPIMLVLLYHFQLSKIAIAALGLPLSFIIGFVSYWFVEQPVLRLRNMQGLPARNIGFAAAAFSLFGILAGSVYFFHDRIADYFSISHSAVSARLEN